MSSGIQRTFPLIRALHSRSTSPSDGLYADAMASGAQRIRLAAADTGQWRHGSRCWRRQARGTPSGAPLGIPRMISGIH